MGCLASLAIASAFAQPPAQPTPPPPGSAQMPPVHSPASTDKKATATKPAKKVDLNNASLEELKTLPTVGDAEAKEIIAHRPYKSKGEL